VLLKENDCTESAIILAVLALEELGKYLIDCWGVKNDANKKKFPSHIEKQSAAFVVLHAREIVKMSPKKFKKIMESDDKRIRNFGPFSEQLQWAKAGFYDDLRMVATYSDQEARWPGEITDDICNFEVADLHTFFRQALVASRDGKAMQIGETIYKNGLGDL
jgi:AbiV family abortive infection protein